MHVIVTDTTPMALEKALRKFNTMVKKAEIMDEVFNRREYVKPSKKKKLKRERAVVKKIRQEKIEAKLRMNRKMDI